jgi:hypothetical protein
MLLRRDEVREVRDQALVELLYPVVGDVLPYGAVVVGRDEDVPADALTTRQAPLDLGEVLGVGVDVQHRSVVQVDPERGGLTGQGVSDPVGQIG